jgi:hypothetical protein
LSSTPAVVLELLALALVALATQDLKVVCCGGSAERNRKNVVVLQVEGAAAFCAATVVALIDRAPHLSIRSTPAACLSSRGNVGLGANLEQLVKADVFVIPCLNGMQIAEGTTALAGLEE